MSETCSLDGQSFVCLTTFKKSGEPVDTPMWFVLDSGKVLMTTRGNSFKVRRIRNNPRVRLAASNAAGRPRGPFLNGSARIVEEPERRQQAVAALNRKYGIKKRLIDFGLRFSKDKTEAILEVSFDEAPSQKGPAEPEAGD